MGTEEGRWPLRRRCAASTPPAFPPLLEQLGISVLVTTYQAGKLVVLRADGGVLNTHFRGFPASRWAWPSTATGWRSAPPCEIWEFHNVPAVAPQAGAARQARRLFSAAPRHVTGDIQIHEMAWARRANSGSSTRASPACARCDAATASCRAGGRRSSPPWRPRTAAISTAWACATAGRAMSRPSAQTDTPGGWRANKKDGGILIDVPSGEVIVRGLSMPHSPRWHAIGSGCSNRAPAASASSTGHRQVREPSPSCPASRAASISAGRFAFVGLSQVRETRRLQRHRHRRAARAERGCGVWVVDIVTGQTVASWFGTRCRRSSPCRSCRPPLPRPDQRQHALIADSFVLAENALTEMSGPFAILHDAGRSPV